MNKNNYFKKYFGTDGIRGRANSSKMNANLALKIGMASAKLFKRGKHKHHVLIGKDTRLSNYTIEPALTSGFLSMGMNVYLTGPLPTPGVASLVSSMRCDVGVMISASHNEYVDNGIKIFCPDGTKLSDDQEIELEKLIDDQKLKLVKSEDLGRAKRIDDAGGRYIEYLKSRMPYSLRLDGLKIVLDCANGAAYKVGPTILWELGAEVIPINITPDGTNVNKNGGSTNLRKLISVVKKTKADLGIALDGDADRCVLIDENGNIVNGDMILGIIATNWKNKKILKNNTVVGTSMTNSALHEYFKKKNINFVRVDVGDRNIIKEMKKRNLILGGEPSGHIILSSLCSSGDGLLASLEVLHTLKERGKKLSFLSNFYKPYPQLNDNFNVKKNTSAEIILKNSKDEILKLSKSLKSNGRLLVRKSGTENKIRIMVESKNKIVANKVLEKTKKALKDINI
ncbi:MAG: Phosphoglucosamine mutase [Alphaproteobacteria bacterium MarineAlpha9_Bin4]|nr:phosphoglucosamine mutase [Pelagibacterales bacterium]PPR26957.1 MAG: Phosphoglucosamine mutase [Alphaproteobacteria bacterium MarineAlpha9_Bin4]